MVLTSLNLEKNWLILMSSVLPWKRGFIWAEKSVFYHKKRVHFWLKSQCFIEKKGLFWAEKCVLPQKRVSFSNWRTRMGTTFSSEWGSWDKIFNSISMATLHWALEKARGAPQIGSSNPGWTFTFFLIFSFIFFFLLSYSFHVYINIP